MVLILKDGMCLKHPFRRRGGLYTSGMRPSRSRYSCIVSGHDSDSSSKRCDGRPSAPFTLPRTTSNAVLSTRISADQYHRLDSRDA